MANWNRPTITNKGTEILNNALNNQSVVISKIRFSSARLSGNLETKTSLTDIKKEITPSSIIKIDDKIKISSIFNNENNSQGYNLETIGIYATVSGVEHLICIISASDSDYIPSDNGSGVITINFDFFINVNRNANITINYNSDSLLKLSDLNSVVNNALDIKANKSDVVSDIRVDGNILSFTKNSNTTRLTLAPEILDATDTNAGKISKNTVRELINGIVTDGRINGLIDTKLNGVGLATSIVSNVDLQSYFATRLFQSNSSSKINGKTTVGINWQYDSTWGVQLGITEEERPKLYIRSKQSGTWRGWNEMATVESVNNVKSALERKIEEKINERIGNFDDIWRGL